jgi:protein-tyrosine phosphatase
MHRSLYEYFADLLFPWIKEIFAALLNEHAPILIHCSAGQDRTGVAAGLILIVLGVPMTTVIEDYLLSTECRTFENELNRAGLEQFAEHNPVARFYTDVLRERGEGTLLPKRLVGSNGEPLLRLAFDAVERRWGSLNDYLLALGVGAPEMARLRELYLE